MGDWIKNNGVSLLILSILVPTVLAGGSFLLDNNSKLIRVEGKVNEVERRVENISEALPGIRVKVAYEKIYSRFSSALLTTAPYFDSGGWNANIHLLDPLAGRMEVYRAALSGPSDPVLGWMLAGSLSSSAAEPVSFAEMKNFTVEVENPRFVSYDLDKNASFVTYVAADKVRDSLHTMMFSKIHEMNSEIVWTWYDLVDAVEHDKLSLFEGIE